MQTHTGLHSKVETSMTLILIQAKHTNSKGPPLLPHALCIACIFCQSCYSQSHEVWLHRSKDHPLSMNSIYNHIPESVRYSEVINTTKMQLFCLRAGSVLLIPPHFSIKSPSQHSSLFLNSLRRCGNQPPRHWYALYQSPTGTDEADKQAQPIFN